MTVVIAIDQVEEYLIQNLSRDFYENWLTDKTVRVRWTNPVSSTPVPNQIDIVLHIAL